MYSFSLEMEIIRMNIRFIRNESLTLVYLLKTADFFTSGISHHKLLLKLKVWFMSSNSLERLSSLDCTSSYTSSSSKSEYSSLYIDYKKKFQSIFYLVMFTSTPNQFLTSQHMCQSPSDQLTEEDKTIKTFIFSLKMITCWMKHLSN